MGALFFAASERSARKVRHYSIKKEYYNINSIDTERRGCAWRLMTSIVKSRGCCSKRS